MAPPWQQACFRPPSSVPLAAPLTSVADASLQEDSTKALRRFPKKNIYAIIEISKCIQPNILP